MIIVMKTISIIIPVYNAAKYIERCLQSVEAQTLHDMEVILVDDHGQDDSISVAKDFVAKSKRKDIHYVFSQTPTNSGPAAARNIGIEKAQGEYISFLDADDWIESQMYEMLFENAKEQKADLSCCNAIMEMGEKSIILSNIKMPLSEITPADRKKILKHYVSYFTTYIYRREWLLAQKIVFPNTRSAEDSCFLTCCLMTANRIAQTEQPFYHYMIHEGSLTQRKVWKGRDKRKAFKVLFAFARHHKLMSTYWPQLMWIYIKKALLVPIAEMIK